MNCYLTIEENLFVFFITLCLNYQDLYFDDNFFNNILKNKSVFKIFVISEKVSLKL